MPPSAEQTMHIAALIALWIVTEPELSINESAVSINANTNPLTAPINNPFFLAVLEAAKPFAKEPKPQHIIAIIVSMMLL